MGHDHGFKHILHGQWRFAFRYPFLGKVVSHRKNAPQVVGWVAPFGSKPGIVVVQPADDATNIPGGFHRIQPERRSRNSGTVRNDSTLDQWAEVFGTLWEPQGEQATA